MNLDEFIKQLHHAGYLKKAYDILVSLEKHGDDAALDVHVQNTLKSFAGKPSYARLCEEYKNQQQTLFMSFTTLGKSERNEAKAKAKAILDEQSNAMLAKLTTLKSSLDTLQKPVDFQPEQAIEIIQGEYGVTHGDAPHFVLASFYASSCLLIAIYDTKNNIAALTHIDCAAEIDSLSRLLTHVDKENSLVYLYGGNLSTISTCVNVVNFMEKHEIKVTKADILRDERSPTVSLAINAKTGFIYTNIVACNATRHVKIPSLKALYIKRRNGNVPIELSFNGLSADYVIKHNNQVLLKQLATRLLLHYATNDKHLALRKAANDGKSQDLKLLIAYGADPSKSGNLSKKTAMDRASSKGHKECISFLQGVLDKINNENASTTTEESVSANTM